LTQVAEQRAKLAALDRQLAQKEAERATSQATIGKIEALTPLVQQEVDIRQTLFNREIGSKLVYLQAMQSLVDRQQELLVQKSRYRETDAAVAAIIATREKTIEEYRHTLFDDLVKTEARAAGLAQDLVKAAERARLQQLTAPIAGLVQQLAVHTVGGVVTPAQSLLVIVPTDSHLEIQAIVSNRDVGFVHAGQPVDIKIDTFPYTRYGLIHGEVESVSADAITADERSDNTPKSESKPRTVADQSSQEPAYEARVSLDRDRIRIDDNTVNLAPGMAVTVEIKTGSRRIISYLLSPLVRYEHESLRER
jgi:hemolysin D